MESIRHLLSFFLKISVAIFMLVLVIWLVSSIPRTPEEKKMSTTSSSTATAKTDLLPSPRKYSGFLSASGTNITKPKVFVAPKPYVYSSQQQYTATGSDPSLKNEDLGYTYTTYTYNGSGVLVPTNSTNSHTADSLPQSSPSSSQNPGTERSTYVRNLSIYEKSLIYNGLSFIGEARSTLFRDGKFPIIVADRTGRVVGFSYAVATTKWDAPGWVRFEAKINFALPNSVPCTMIFEEALTRSERTRQPLRIPMQVMCN